MWINKNITLHKMKAVVYTIWSIEDLHYTHIQGLLLCTCYFKSKLSMQKGKKKENIPHNLRLNNQIRKTMWLWGKYMKSL